MVQIDVKEELDSCMSCILYADGRAVKIYMSKDDYRALIHDGFFIRDGNEKDSANVLNTTDEYYFDRKTRDNESTTDKA